MKIKRLWIIPEDLGKHGKRLWKNVGRQLVEGEVLDALDRESFETLCRTYHKMITCDNLLEEEGLNIEGKKNPIFSEWKAYSDLYVKLLYHFGMSPYSRGIKIKPKEEVKQDAKEQYFAPKS